MSQSGLEGGGTLPGFTWRASGATGGVRKGCENSLPASRTTVSLGASPGHSGNSFPLATMTGPCHSSERTKALLGLLLELWGREHPSWGLLGWWWGSLVLLAVISPPDGLWRTPARKKEELKVHVTFSQEPQLI